MGHAELGYIAKLDLNWRYTTSFYNPRFGKYAPVLVSDDWSTIGLNSLGAMSTESVRAVRWTRATGSQDLGQFGDTGSTMFSMSTDGSVFFGNSAPLGSSLQNSFRWTQDTGSVSFGQTLGNYYLMSNDRKTVTAIDRDGGALDLFERFDGTSQVRSAPVAGSYQLKTSVLAGDGLTAFGQYTNGSTAHAVRWNGIQGATPVDLGTLGGATSEVLNTNLDGSVAFGISRRADGSSQAFRWTSASGIQEVVPTTASGSAFTDINSAGTAGFGWMYTTAGTREFIWTQAGGFQDIGSLGSGSLYADKTSIDNSTFVGISALTGFGKPHAVRWSQATGLVDLGFTNMNNITFAGGSDDLSVLVYNTTDTSNHKALYRVSGANVLTNLGNLDGVAPTVLGMSHDGKKMLVTSSIQMYYWDETSGFHDMGMIGGVHLSSDSTMTISPEFDLVGGSMMVSGVKTAWIYDPFTGVHDLRQLLVDNGADMTDWDSLNQIDLIEDVNGTAYVTGLGTYKGVSGFKFFAAVPEPTTMVGIGLGIVALIRRRRKAA